MEEPEQLEEGTGPTATGADGPPNPPASPRSASLASTAPASTSSTAPPESSSESEQQLRTGSAELRLGAAGNAGGGRGTSTTAAAGEARTSPHSSPNRVAGVVIAASAVLPASPQPRPREQNDASARNGPGLINLDSALAHPSLNGGVAVVGDEVGTGFDDVNGGSAPANCSSSSGPISAPPAPSQTPDEHAASKLAEGDDVNLPEVAVGDAPTSPASPASPSRVAAVTDALGLRPASPPLTKEQNAASTSTAGNGLDLNSDSALALPGLNGGVVVGDEVGTVANDVNGGSAPVKSSSSPVSVPPAPAQTLDEHAASTSTSRNSPCLNAISALQPPRLNGGVVSLDEVGVDVSGGSALTSSSSGTFSVPAPPAADPSQTLEKLGGSALAEDGSSDIDKADPACICSSTPPVGFSAAPLASPRSNGSIVADNKVAADADSVNGTSDKTSSSVLPPPLLQVQGDNSKLKSTTTNGCLHSRAEKPQSTSQALDSETEREAKLALQLQPDDKAKHFEDRVNEFKARLQEAENDQKRMQEYLLQKEAALQQQLIDQKQLLQGEVNELKARLEESQERQNMKGEEFLKQESAVLLHRILIREKRAKALEKAGGSRTLNPSNTHDGAAVTRGCKPHHEVAEVLFGNNVVSDLILPLLQCSQMSAPTPVPADNHPVNPALPAAAPEDDMWNKRQISYVLYLGLAVGLMFIIRPFLPRVLDQYLLAGFAGIWGVGSIGLPAGIFETSRLEKEVSRHIGRFISLFFSLMVIYGAYLLASTPVNTDGSFPCPPPSAPAADSKVDSVRIIFCFVGGIVSIGHIASWVMGCRTGGDRDLLP